MEQYHETRQQQKKNSNDTLEGVIMEYGYSRNERDSAN